MVTLNMPGPACATVRLETLGGATISGLGMEILLSIVTIHCTSDQPIFRAPAEGYENDVSVIDQVQQEQAQQDLGQEQ
jgi:hypothetical protein